MTRTDVFFDSNVLVYQLSGDAGKADLSEKLLRAGGVVSVQILNETVSVLRRKFRVAWRSIRPALTTVRATVEIVPITVAIHELGLAIAERHGVPLFDAMIVAAAELAGCRKLYSEDFQHGQRIGNITIENPYR